MDKIPDKLNVIIKSMTVSDIPEVQALERQCFNYTWPEDSFERELANVRSACYLIARENGKMVGFVGSWLIMDEAHITTIAIAPEYRGHRAGTMLIWSMFKKALDKGCRWATIEVSEKNLSAQKLYKKFDFVSIGKRTSYYAPNEDANVMWVKDIQGENFRYILERNRSEWEEKICLSWE
jgi:ribosomal-protein-alanine N-acetyltransferase